MPIKQTDHRAIRYRERTHPVEPEVVELREWTRIADELTTERTRLANRVRQQLWRYYPQILTVDSDPAKAWVLDLWQLAPTPDKARRVRKDTVARLLKRHRVRCIDAEEVLRRLREPAIPVAPGTAEAAVAHIDTVAERLALVRRQLAQAHVKMERLTEALAAAMENPQDKPGIEAQRDVAILASLPGVGRIVLATLLAEAFDPLRRRDYHALRCLCGTAPVTRRSGKSMIVVRRLAAHNRLRDAVYHWARVAVQRDPISKAKYAALRARGHGHARALRSVADRLIAVACAMLENQTVFATDHPRQRHAA